MGVSGFNGDEPSPTKVDLPMGELNSYAARITQQFSPKIYLMASAAFVKSPESHDPDLDHIWRYSASLYNHLDLGNGWDFHNTLIWGLVNFYDDTSALNSFGEEFLVQKDKQSSWGRIEHLERTASELQVASTSPHQAKWVTAITLGSTYQISKIDDWIFGLGSVTKDFLPQEFESPYAGDPLTARVFLQIGTEKMWDF